MLLKVELGKSDRYPETPLLGGLLTLPNFLEATNATPLVDFVL
ncbi:hypothetical protein PNQ29_06755 [Halobacterium salinarum]|nr:hypothetical protein [Halobacterium salinarum]MDL0119428.1 hypothetical protein [Halobacterium salinarum]